MVVQNGIAVQVKQLNLRQIVEIGASFQNLGPGTKLLGMDIVQTAGQSHYYDVILKVVNFGLPSMTDAAQESGSESKRRLPKRPSSRRDEEGDE
ncbi:MAG: hypothetical protein HC902_14850 [Calothrix sp. SM1_5_4]|nr:hypothetical protein [Calothrix sp. SM1_5_4]